MNPEPTTATEIVGDVKPKRQLTEAQRLAFMKGREKRLANLAKRREEKLEAERENSNMNVDPVVPQTSSPQEVASDGDLAKRVADMVMERMSTVHSAPPEPKPKRKYTRRVKVPEAIAPPVVKRSSASEYASDDDAEEFKLFAPVPQKTYNWM